MVARPAFWHFGHELSETENAKIEIGMAYPGASPGGIDLSSRPLVPSSQLSPMVLVATRKHVGGDGASPAVKVALPILPNLPNPGTPWCSTFKPASFDRAELESSAGMTAALLEALFTDGLVVVTGVQIDG